MKLPESFLFFKRLRPIATDYTLRRCHIQATTCPGCGLDLGDQRGSHSCESSHSDTHAANCSCVYCVAEQRFAAGSYLGTTPQERAIDTLEALIAQWNLVKAEYDSAEFERREELCDVKEELRSQFAEYLDVREKRKVLQAICRDNSRIRLGFAQVCHDLVWSRVFERALRLG